MVDDLSYHGGSTIVHHTNNQGAYHLRMISYRSTLTNRTGLKRNEGEVSAVHLHRDPVFLTGKFDPILHRIDSPVNDLWVNLPVVNSWTSLPVIEGTGRDKSHRTNPRNRIGPDRTGCQSPEPSNVYERYRIDFDSFTLFLNALVFSYESTATFFNLEFVAKLFESLKLLPQIPDRLTNFKNGLWTIRLS